MEKFNPEKFIERCSDIIGEYRKDCFAEQLSRELEDNEWCRVTSPIEQILYIALQALIEYEGICSVKIAPQHKIDKYIVDFAIFYSNEEACLWSVIVKFGMKERKGNVDMRKKETDFYKVRVIRFTAIPEKK